MAGFLLPMTFLERLRDFFRRRAPGKVSNVRVTITMQEFTAEWVLPAVRKDGSKMPPSEIAGTEASLSTDGGKTFALLATVKPDVPQTVRRAPAPDGKYVLRLVVVGTNGKKGDSVDTPITVDTPAPGLATGIKVSIA